MKLATKRLILRDLKDKDKNVLPLIVNDLEISRYLAVVPYPYKKKDAIWFVDKCKKDSKEKPRKNYEIGIELKDTSELIGVIGLNHVDLWNGRATLGYWLAKKYWRQGITYEAVQVVLGFAFNKLKLQRIDIEAAVENIPSNNLIKKFGSRFEGVAKRKHKTKATGEYRDSNLYGLLKEDWIKSKK